MQIAKIKTFLAVIAVISVLLILPFYYALLYWMLAALSAPTWIWVLYWIMVPVAIGAGIFNRWLISLVEQQTKEKAYKEFLSEQINSVDSKWR